MILLDKTHYTKLLDPLKKVTINNLFAHSVVEKMVEGKVFVDDADNPKTFYVLHPCGMSLLFGDSDNEEFNMAFRKYALNQSNNRNSVEWMQVFPSDWDAVLKDLLHENLVEPGYQHKSADTVELNTRVNFKFNKEKFINNVRENYEIDTNIRIIQTDKDAFHIMTGAVVPLNFWNNVDDSIHKGVAFSLFYDDKLASTAFSAFIEDDKLELGIEIYEVFKGKGLAYQTCLALIAYCLENGFEPVWACKRDDIGSYLLAQQLGFENFKEISYYRLGFD